MNSAFVLPLSKGELEGVALKTNNHAPPHLKKGRNKLRTPHSSSPFLRGS